MSSLPVAAVLATWLDAVRAGHVGPGRPRRCRARRRPAPPRHRAGRPVRPVELARAPGGLLDGPGRRWRCRLPGDPLGLGGPADFNASRARGRGGRRRRATSGWSRPRTRARSCGTAHRADPVPWVDERESRRSELRTALVGGDPPAGRPRRRLVAARDPRPADQPAPPAADSPCPRFEPRGSRPSSARCCACEIVDAGPATGEGGAVSSYEMRAAGAPPSATSTRAARDGPWSAPARAAQPELSGAR